MPVATLSQRQRAEVVRAVTALRSCSRAAQRISGPTGVQLPVLAVAAPGLRPSFPEWARKQSRCVAAGRRVRSRFVWSRYIAVGDSFSEGLDDVYADGSFRGWADRLAELLWQESPDLRYANLAIRGRRTDRIVTEQVPEAVAQGPDLVTFASGINDLMGRRWDPAVTFEHMSRGLAQLRASGADVLVVGFGDPVDRRGSTARWRDRFELLNRGTVALAREHGCYVLDFWPLTHHTHDGHWSEDRLHLSAAGHAATARAAAEVLGFGDGRWREDDGEPPARPGLVNRTASDILWLRKHALPWVARRLLGRSSGEEIVAKRPVLTALRDVPLPDVLTPATSLPTHDDRGIAG